MQVVVSPFFDESSVLRDGEVAWPSMLALVTPAGKGRLCQRPAIRPLPDLTIVYVPNTIDLDELPCIDRHAIITLVD